MNSDIESIKLGLMKHVERAVRPVVAPPARKLAMRREMLAHLTDLFNDEIGRCGDAGTAMSRAIERFGSAVELTPQLQAGVSRCQRAAERVNAWWRRREGDSAVRHALRVSIGTMLATAGYSLFIAVLVLGVIATIRPAREQPFSGVVLYLLPAAGAVGGFVFALLWHAMNQTIRRARTFSGVLAILGLAALSGVSAFLLAALFAATAAGNVQYMFGEFPGLYALLVFGPAMMLVLSAVAEHERRQYAQWTDLAIDG